jgi:predicted nucleotidyltransferase
LDALLIRIAEELNVPIPALVKASGNSVRQLDDFKQGLERLLPEEEAEEYQNVDVILTGSFARRELTEGSDCDYLITSLQTVGHRIMPLMVKNVQKVMQDLQFRDPGTQGVFADFTPAADLIWRIGLDGDTNTNITRRTLILTESVSVLHPSLRITLIDRMLSRYCSDYHPRFRDSDDSVIVPRFLLNDIIRYWRTIAVDFGAKQWRAVRSDMGLRYAKLLTTRKVLFSGTLVSLFLTRHALERADPANSTYDRLKNYLQAEFSKTPLTRLMTAYDYVSPDGKRALANVLAGYNRFMEILDSPDMRELITADPVSSDEAKEVMEEVQAIGDAIETGLEVIFFDEPIFSDLTRRYALF